MKPLSKLPVSAMLFLAISFFQCQQVGVEQKDMTSLEEHELISAFTSGTIDRKTEVYIRFTIPVASNIAEDPQKLAGLVKITPAIEGNWSVLDDQSVTFKPKGLWPVGERYTFQMQPGDIVDSNGGEEGVFYFTVLTGEPRLSVNLEALEPAASGKYRLTGRLQCSDWLTPEEAKGLLIAEINGSGLKIAWDDAGDQRLHHFYVDNIERSSRSGEVNIALNSLPSFRIKPWSKKIRIPSMDEFSLLDYQISLGDPKGVILIFSDPLSEDQTPDGLIQMVDYPAGYRLVKNRERITVIPDEMKAGEHKLRILKSLKNDRGINLDETHMISVHFEAAPPALEWASKGSLLPVSSDGQLSFTATNVKSVSMEIFRVREQNMLDYLQDNAWGEDRYLTRVGYVVHREEIELDDVSNIELNKPRLYTLDLSSWMDRDPNALYEVRLGFSKWDAITPCQWGTKPAADTLNWPYNTRSGDSFWDYNYYGLDGYYDDFEWEDRDDPCKPAFYNRDRFIAQMIFPVSLGLTVKSNDGGQYWAVVSDLENGSPVSGASIKWYNFQKELLGTSDSDSDGFSEFNNKGEEPVYFVEAGFGGERTFLRLQEGESLSLSAFDVSGKRVSSERDVFLYGERDIWRPGDSIYIFAVVRNGSVPSTMKAPVRYRFRDPSGRIVSQGRLPDPKGHILPVFVATQPEDRTGNWSLQLAIGDEVYSRQVAVESIKPNRFLFTWADPDEPVKDWRDSRHELSLQWLYGAPAKGVSVTAELRNSRLIKPFDKFIDYQFHDLSESWNDPSVIWAEGTTGQDGKIILSKKAGLGQATGPAISKWTVRASEPGGGFSVDQFSRKLFPYPSYAGVRLRQDEEGFFRAAIGEENPVDLVRVDASGNSIAGELQVAIDKVSWRWWWDNDEGSEWNYSSREVLEPVKNVRLQTDASGKARVNFNPPDWGRYRIKVCDLQSGHCASSFLYAGSPDFDDLDRGEAARINFELDRTEYHPGDQASMDLPSVFKGAAMVSIENGTGVIERFWSPIKPGGNTISFQVNEEMIPSAYVNVSLIQSMSTIESQAPFRMYGIQPMQVSGKGSRLKILADIPDAVRSAQDINVTVRENSGSAMDYSIAVVDEGLLQLTRFTTPDPWQYFHEKEALGIKTWDMYDQLIISSQSVPDRLIAVGGDGALLRSDGQQSANRFPPVVRVLGPFHLEKGQKATHKIALPQYMGSVRVMVVGAGEQAWGSYEKRVTVKDPIMLFSSAPRVLTPGDELKFPLTIISTVEGVKEIGWEIKDLNGVLEFPEGKQGTARIEGPGEQTVYVPVRVTDRSTSANIEMTAKSSGDVIKGSVQIPVRDPLPFKTVVESWTLQPGESKEFEYAPLGPPRFASGTLELMGIAPVSVDDKLDYLLRYPHGCLEQTVSQAFAELFLPEFSKLSEKQSRSRDDHVRAAIGRIRGFVTGSGSFAIWPGSDHVNIWADIYAAHFLKEASGLGFRVPEQLLRDWEKRARRLAVSWAPGRAGEGEVIRSTDLEQAYRLYVLALLGSPELGAMNILREESALSSQALYFLAAAYARLGQHEEADRLLALGRRTDVKKYDPSNYGSAIRELSIGLLSYADRNDQTEAFKMALELGARFSRTKYFTTQEAGFALLALGKFYKGLASDHKMKLQIMANGSEWTSMSSYPVENVAVKEPESPQEISVSNQGERPVFGFLKRTGKDPELFSSSSSEGLSLEVRYSSLDGSPIQVASLASGTEFEAVISLRRTGNLWQDVASDLALTFTLPAGWEFLDREAGSDQMGIALNYTDQRDDKINYYFDLARREAIFRIRLRAAYSGTYYFPPCFAEMMYDPSVSAHTAGKRVLVSD